MAIRLDIDRQALAALCRRWGIRELAVFGSALRPDFGAESDVDLMLTFEEGVERSLFDLSAIAMELEALFGRPVDLLTRRGVEQSRNPYRRDEILSTAEPLYAA